MAISLTDRLFDPLSGTFVEQFKTAEIESNNRTYHKPNIRPLIHAEINIAFNYYFCRTQK